MYDFENIQGNLYGTPSSKRSGSKGSRAELETHFREVPAHIKAELQAGNLRLGDTMIYSIRQVGTSTTVKMFLTQDDKETGLRNVSKAKLEKNQALMVSGIFLLAGEAQAQTPGSPTKDELKATEFRSLDAPGFAAIANGEFSLDANKVTIVPPTSMRVFCTANNHNSPAGFYKLHNPRLIQDDVLLEATLELGTTQNLPQDTVIYLGLYGTVTTP